MISSCVIDFSPMKESSFSSGVSIGFSLIDTRELELFFSIFIQPFFLAFAIATLNPAPDNTERIC